jgi:negative regulator of sigma E activity
MNRAFGFPYATSLSALLLGAISICTGQTPSGESILKRVDENLLSGTKISVGEMRIQERREVRTVRMKSRMRGLKKSFTEFLSPARDKGTKMLKLDDQIWTYAPSTDRTILISGHMLRQSVMGSDLSYEDLLEDPALAAAYDAKVTGEDTVAGRPCWVLELTSKGQDVAYQSRTIHVDRERNLVLKEDRFARSGKLLKTTEVRAVVRVGGRWVASEAIVKDALKTGAGTEFVVESVSFDEAIPDFYFSKAALRR